MKNNLKMLIMVIIATCFLQKETLKAIDPLIMIIPADKKLKDLKIKDIYKDDTKMQDWQFNFLGNELERLKNSGGGVIPGIITKNGTRVVFKLPSNGTPENLPMWIGISLLGRLSSITFTTTDNTVSSIGIPAETTDNTPVYIIQQNASNSISIPAKETTIPNFSIPNFVYIDIPTHQGLVTVSTDGGSIQWSDAPNWGDLQGLINKMTFGQEISGTCFGDAGLSLPYVSNFAFSSKKMEPETGTSYAFQPFLTDESGQILPHGAQQPTPSVGTLKKGDQIVFRKIEAILYNTKIVKEDGKYLYMIEFGDDQGNVARLAPDWFDKLKSIVSLINVPKKGYDWDNTVFEETSDSVEDIGQTVGNTVESAGQSAGKVVRETMDSAGNLVQNAGELAGNTVINTLGSAGNIVKDTLDTVGNAAKNTVGAAAEVTGAINQGVGYTVYQAGASAESIVKKTGDSTKATIDTAGQNAGNLTKDITKTTAGTIKDIGSSAGQITEDVTKSVADSSKDIAKSVSSSIRGVGESTIVKGAGMIASVFNGKAFERSQGMEYNGSVVCTLVYNEANKAFCPQFKTNYNYSHWSIHPHRHFSRREAPLTFNTAGNGNLKNLKYIIYKFADAQTNQLEMLQKIVYDPIITKAGAILWDQGHTEPYKPFCAESKKEVVNC